MMRRAVVGAFCVLAVVTAFGLAASAERDLAVMVDGRRLAFDVPPRIVGDRVLAPGAWAYDVEFDMADSTGPAGTTASRIYVEKSDASESEPRSGYLVVQVYEPCRLDIPQMKVSLLAPSGWSVRDVTPAEASLAGPAGAPVGGVQVLGGLFLPNHSVTEREVAVGSTPDRKVYVVEISEPAASGSTETRRELHGFIPRGDGSYLDVWVLVSPGWSVESQVDMFARMLAGTVVSR